jgi:hypothetical protein
MSPCLTKLSGSIPFHSTPKVQTPNQNSQNRTHGLVRVVACLQVAAHATGRALAERRLVDGLVGLGRGRKWVGPACAVLVVASAGHHALHTPQCQCQCQFELQSMGKRTNSYRVRVPAPGLGRRAAFAPELGKYSLASCYQEMGN